MMRGVTSMPRRQGGAAAMNHVIHGDDTATPACAARSRQRRFCAAAVRKRLDEKLETCSTVKTRKEPSFLLVSPGSEPALSESDLMMGMKMPPARALARGFACEAACSQFHARRRASRRVTRDRCVLWERRARQVPLGRRAGSEDKREGVHQRAQRWTAWRAR